METVMESLTLLRCSTLPLSKSRPSSVSLFSRFPVAERVPHVIGLKRIGLTSSSTSPPARSVRSTSRGSGIVCEAQQQDTTALEVPAVTDATWDSLVLGSQSTVLVEFWAPWCGPCRMIQPIIDELARQYAGKLNFYKMNTDESPNTASRYGIRSIPTFMIFKDGEKKEAIIGAVPKSTLTTSIDKFS